MTATDSSRAPESGLGTFRTPAALSISRQKLQALHQPPCQCRIDQPVQAVTARATPVDDAVRPQDGQMLRDPRRRQTERAGQTLNIRFVIAQHLRQAQAIRVRDHFQQVRIAGGDSIKAGHEYSPVDRGPLCPDGICSFTQLQSLEYFRSHKVVVAADQQLLGPATRQGA
ncbi:MAG: hypothetical protein R3315_04040 [Woeseiaceae bacterium]|nr:hypothetical protein [Woeseiaceae bacterium]